LDLAQAMYFLDGPQGKKIVITCTVPATQESIFKPLFDSCIKSCTIPPS